MKRALSFLLALFLFGGVFFPAEASAMQEEAVVPQSTVTTAWIAGAMKMLGIKDANGKTLNHKTITLR